MIIKRTGNIVEFTTDYRIPLRGIGESQEDFEMRLNALETTEEPKRETSVLDKVREVVYDAWEAGDWWAQDASILLHDDSESARAERDRYFRNDAPFYSHDDVLNVLWRLVTPKYAGIETYCGGHVESIVLGDDEREHGMVRITRFFEAGSYYYSVADVYA